MIGGFTQFTDRIRRLLGLGDEKLSEARLKLIANEVGDGELKAARTLEVFGIGDIEDDAALKNVLQEIGAQPEGHQLSKVEVDDTSQGTSGGVERG